MADVVAGKVTYQIAADVSALKDGIDKANGHFSDLASKLKAIESQTTTTSLALANAFGNLVSSSVTSALQKIPELFTNARDAAAGFARTSSDLRLPVDLIMALQHAGALAGVSVSDMNSALSHFTDQTKKTNDDAKDFYKALSNIDPAFAKGVAGAKTQAEALKIVMDAFGKATTEVQRAQLAEQAFGTDSERLSGMFKNGRASLDEYSEAARKAGVILDQGIAQQAEKAKNKTEAFAIVVQANLTRAFAELIPVLDAVMQQLPRFIELASGAIAAIGGPKFLTDKLLNDRVKELKP